MHSLNKVFLLGAVMLLLATGAWSWETAKNRQMEMAALALPTGSRADWQQWDSFLTNVVKKLGQDFRPDQRDQLSEMFIDARYQLVQALSSGASDPVPQLFTDAWSRLAPIMKQATPGASQQTASQYTSFIGAMDAASSFSGIGQRFGVFRVTPDALRGASPRKEQADGGAQSVRLKDFVMNTRAHLADAKGNDLAEQLGAHGLTDSFSAMTC